MLFVKQKKIKEKEKRITEYMPDSTSDGKQFHQLVLKGIFLLFEHF